MKQFNAPGRINESVKSKTLQQLINTRDKWQGNKDFVSWLDANDYRLSEISDANFVEVNKTTEDVQKAYKDKNNIIAINQQSGEVVVFIYGDRFIVNVVDKKRVGQLVSSLANWPDTKVYKLVNIGSIKKKTTTGSAFNEKLFFEQLTRQRITTSKALVIARDVVKTLQPLIISDDAKRTLESPALQQAMIAIAIKYGAKEREINDIKTGTAEVSLSGGYAEQAVLRIKYKYKSTYDGAVYGAVVDVCSAYTESGRKSYGSRQTNVLGDIVTSFIDSWTLSFDSVELGKSYMSKDNADRVNFERELLTTDAVIAKACLMPDEYDKWAVKNNVSVVPMAAATKPKNKWSNISELVEFISNYGNMVTEFSNYDCFVLFNEKFPDTVYVATTAERVKNIREKYPLSANTIVLSAITDNASKWNKTIDLSKIPGAFILNCQVITSFNAKGSTHSTRYIDFASWLSKNADQSFGNHTIITSTNTLAEQQKWSEYFAKNLVKLLEDANAKYPNAAVTFSDKDDRYVGSHVYNIIKSVFAGNYKLANSAQAIAEAAMQKLINK